MGYLSLREYGLIGNQGLAALVSRLGSIDWCCFPYLDSQSHFGSLLDENQGGHFRISPIGDFHSEQRYLQRTNVLETKFETPTGRGLILDWMPASATAQPEPIIHRRVEVVDGQVSWEMTCVPRFGYASETAHGETYRGGLLFRGNSPAELAVLRASVPIQLMSGGRSASARFELTAGQRSHFSWTWGRHGRGEVDFPDPQDTIDFWREWAHRCGEEDTGGPCAFAGPWHDMVTRSSLLLKILANHFSGAIAESVTTSLPSLIGGSRNWDYRYAWVRDGAMAIQALTALGHREESEAFFGWLADIIARDGAEALQAVYTLDGGRFLPERELTFLSGYEGSRPVRVGNLSARQFQLDIYGHVLLATTQHYAHHGSLPGDLWPRIAEVTEYVCQAWRRPDRGPWESRSKPEHFVASKVMCWVALDRAIKLAHALGQEVPRRWTEERVTLHRTICEQGYDENRRSFVRAFGERDLDAAVLLIPLVGFLPIDDDRVQSTLDAIQAELSDGVLVHRYRSTDGLPESDGAHLVSSFWFVSCLALAGRADEASDRLAELCSYASPMGLFSEQVDPLNGDPAGNFPSASAHLSLVNASLFVGMARGRKVPYQPVIGGLTTDLDLLGKSKKTKVA